MFCTERSGVQSTVDHTRLSVKQRIKFYHLHNKRQLEVFSMLFISVVVPVRNESKHIEAVLDQLLVQDYDPSRFEIIVADGQSDDNTKEIVGRYVEKHPNVRLFDNPKRLSCAARNIGIQNAQGDVVLVVDGHCLIDNPQMLRNVDVAFEKSEADCLGRPQPLELSHATSTQLAIAAGRRSFLGHHADSFIYSAESRFSPAISVGVAYRKELFKKIGLFDERFDACEDAELNYRVDKSESKCFFDPNIAVRYVPRGTISGLFYQMVRYGRGRVRLCRKHPETFSLKSFCTAFFIVGLIVGLPLCFVHPIFLWTYLSVVGLYLATVAAETVRGAWQAKRLDFLFLLPMVFGAVHFGSGYGVLREFLFGPRITHENEPGTVVPTKRPGRVISWQKRLAYWLLRTPTMLFFMIFYRVRFYGRNNLPESGPVLVFSNHQSHFDPPLLGAGLRRRLNYLARKSLFKFKPFAKIIDLLDAIPLDIDGIGFEGVKESLKRLKNGEMILIFPEGARTWDGEIGPFKQGATTLALRGKAAILPTAIDGCFDAWPRMNKLPWCWGKIRVVFGEPIFYDDFKDLSEEELSRLVETKIHELFERIRIKGTGCKGAGRKEGD